MSNSGALPPGIVVMMTGELARYSDSMSDLIGLNMPEGSGFVWFKGVLIANGLNKGLAAMVAKPEMQWAWIMGDDHRFDRDVLQRQLAKGFDASVPLCLHRKPPFATTIIDCSGDKRRHRLASEFPTTGEYKLTPDEMCGDAGLLVRRRVVEAIEPPWYDNRRSGSFASDDLAFSKRIREAGFDIWLDLDSVLGHITPMAITPKRVNGKWTVNLAAGDDPVASLDPELFRPGMEESIDRGRPV